MIAPEIFMAIFPVICPVIFLAIFLAIPLAIVPANSSGVPPGNSLGRRRRLRFR